MDAPIITILLGLLSSLVAAQVFVTKSLLKRSDERSAASDKHIGELIGGLRLALNSFQRFEQEEMRTHARILETQERMIEVLGRIENRLRDHQTESS